MQAVKDNSIQQQMNNRMLFFFCLFLFLVLAFTLGTVVRYGLHRCGGRFSVRTGNCVFFLFLPGCTFPFVPVKAC